MIASGDQNRNYVGGGGKLWLLFCVNRDVSNNKSLSKRFGFACITRIINVLKSET